MKKCVPPTALTPVLTVLFIALFTPAPAFSQGCPPAPASGQPVLLDLGGNVNGVCPSLPTTSAQPIPGGGNGTYQQYTASFTATGSSVTLTFAFRDDAANISFTNVSVTDLTNPGGNLLTNGNFSGGTTSSGGNASAPANWTYNNVNAQGYEGVVTSSSNDCYTSSNCWYDGSYEGYDTISQSITTNNGDNYQISFYVAEDSYCSGNGNSSPCNFSDVDTNASNAVGNGIDVVVYATGATVPASQTLTLTLLDSGVGTVTDNLGVLGTCSESGGVVSQNGTPSSSSTCTATYPLGTVVILTATPTSPSTFGATASQSASGVAIPGWGGGCTSSEKNPDVCDLSMDSAQNVTAAFVTPGQSGTGQVTTTQPADYGFNGGINNLDSGGNDLNVQLTSGSSTTVSVTQISVSQEACNNVLALAFPNAYCFVYQLGATPSEPPDSAQMYELTCPGSATGGTCGSISAATFFAILGADFIFSTSTQGANENPGLTTSGSSSNTPPNPTLMYDSGNPYVGVAKFAGSDPLHPCSLPANPSSGSFTEPLSNQIASFTFQDGLDTASPVKASSSGTGSCWIVTYNMPNEVPTVSINAGGPTNGQDVVQNSQLTASFTCNAVNTGNSSPVGPYLTVNSCTLTDSYTGSGSPQSYSATTGTASTTDGPVPLDTSTPGPHTVTATVVDSATNTISTSPVTYNVQGGTSTVVTSSSNPSTYGQSVTFTAAVTGAPGAPTPTGTMTWSSNTNCGTTQVSGGSATCVSSLGPVGSYPVTASYSGDNYNASSTSATLNQTVTAATATVTLGNLTQTYTGSALSPTVTTSPSGLSYTLTGAPDTNAGSYSVTATINSGQNYTGSASGTFVITTATATVTLSNLTQTYTGSALSPTVTTSPSGLSYTLTGAPDTNAGSYSVTATINSGQNYTGSASGTFVISAPAWTITPSTHSFGTLSLGQSASQTFTVTNPTTTSTSIKVCIPGSGGEGGSTPNEIDADDYVITSNSCPASLGAGKSCTVTVTWTPDSDDLPLYATGGSLAYLQVTNSSKTVLAYAAMTGKALDPTASLSASSYSFGSVTKGSSVTEEAATVTNSGPTTLILGTTGISGSSTFTLASGSGSCTNGESIPSGSSCAIYVTFKPTSASSQSGTVTINSNATNTPLTIALSGK